MSVLLRTISAFPTGRTTQQLFALLDVDFDPRQRTAIYAELSQLLESGKIAKGRDGKWRAINVAVKPNGLSTAVPEQNSNILLPVHAQFRSKVVAQIDDMAPDEQVADFDANALIRYYRSALRSDPRGAINQQADHHGVQWQLITGFGPLTPDEGTVLTISIQLDDLPSEFRQALLKRQANEQSLAIGWPMAVGKSRGMPVIWPVGLICAEWQRSSTHLDIVVDSDNIIANPDWIKGAARHANWTEKSLREVMTLPSGLGFSREEFLSRLKEAVSTAFCGQVRGQQMRSELNLGATGIHDIAGFFLPTDSTFTTYAGRDLDTIATWSKEMLSATALAPLLGLKAPLKLATPAADNNKALPAAINISELNKEQIEAVRYSLIEPLTVVTGPPGTGKSQTILSIVASVLIDGGNVVVASKNHQALDAVEQRLGSIAPHVPFMVRTLDPTRDIDLSFNQVLKEMIAEPSAPVRSVDWDLRLKLARLAQRRDLLLDKINEQTLLHSQIADLLERLQAHMVTDDEQKVETVPQRKMGLLRKLLDILLRIIGLARGEHGSSTGVDLQASLLSQIDELRQKIEEIDGDPVAMTEEIAKIARQLLPNILSSFVTLTEDERQRLGEELANLELTQNAKILPFELSKDIVKHRPLWLVSALAAPRRMPLYDGLFDLAIFDEASQCDIASALPILARAKRAVIVGDNQQLSFISGLGIAHDRNLMQAQNLPLAKMGRFAQSRKSLFDLCNLTPNVAKVMLRDQYRSASGIVNYINDNFYAGRLRVAYDEKAMKIPSNAKAGLAWTNVSAPTLPMGENINMAEVEAITNYVKMLLVEQGYGGTIGVIAPFRPQVAKLFEAITAAIDSKQLDFSQLRVATVDGFQGQERDLIVFSPTLGMSSTMSAVSFVQKEGRRLNVAISRARAVAHIFGDLTYARSGRVSSLKILAAAATEPRARVSEGIFDSHWERVVYQALKHYGLEPIPQFEIAGRRLDFALYGQNNIKLDLEVDGRKWHTDIDGKRKMSDYWRDHQMRSLGWKVQRFWVDELEKDLEGCIERVKQQLS